MSQKQDHSSTGKGILYTIGHLLVQDLLDLGAWTDGEEKGPGLECIAMQDLDQRAVVGGLRAVLLVTGSSKDPFEAGKTGNQVLRKG